MIWSKYINKKATYSQVNTYEYLASQPLKLYANALGKAKYSEQQYPCMTGKASITKKLKRL